MTPTNGNPVNGRRFDLDSDLDATQSAAPSATPADKAKAREAVDDDDPRLVAAVQEYMAALESGKRISRHELLARHPDIAEELSDCLDGLAFVHSAAAKMQGGDAGAPSAHEGPDIDPERAQPLGDFRLIREIGRGGMGVVYEAIQLSLGRRVAVKVLPLASAFDPRHLQRFRNEAQAAAQLHHSNIVPVYAVGSERGVHFYAMQLIEGQSLDDVIRELRTGVSHPAVGHPDEGKTPGVGLLDTSDSPTATWRPGPAPGSSRNRASPRPGGPAGGSPAATVGAPQQSVLETLPSLRSQKRATFYRTVARLALQAAEALEYAHQLGVVHRDIKPANLMLDVRGNLWITDFGLAQFYAESGGLTQTGDILGTLRYMSPEQAGGRAVVLDQRTDVYSLGMTMYELLTLERALPGETREQLLHQIDKVDPRLPRSIDKSIPPELETILMKAVSKEPSDRYATAGALADDLRRFLHDEPILARPPSLRDKAVKWTRRHRAVAVSVVVVLFLATAGLLTSTLLIAKEQSKTKVALHDAENKAREANEQKALADKSFHQARAAVDYFTGIAAERMDKPDPEIRELRREMLEAALSYYRTFLDEREDDPSVAEQLTNARSRVTNILTELAAKDEFFRMGLRVRLLREEAVQKELGLNDEQETRVEAVAEDFSKEFWPIMKELGKLSPENRRDRLSAPTRAAEQAMAEALSPLQVDRFNQIFRQVTAPGSFSDPDVEKELGLTQAQRAAIRKVQDRYMESRFRRGPGGPGGPGGGPGGPSGPPPGPPPDGPGGGPGARGDRDDAQPDPNALKQAAVNEILDKLTPAQAATWKRLTGEPFTAQVNLFGPRFGHRGGGRGGPDRGNR